MKPTGHAGQRRVVVDRVFPEVDGGRHPIKRVQGDTVDIEADIVADGHDRISAVVAWRTAGSRSWKERPLQLVTNDRWHGEFDVEVLGFYEYTVIAWIDHFGSWLEGLTKKHDAAVVEEADLAIGAALIADGAARARGRDRSRLEARAVELADAKRSLDERVGIALEASLAETMGRAPDRENAATYRNTLRVWVDRTRARFSAWYELFPRSCGRATEYGSFSDVMERLPSVAQMGFDVVYLPPIHPIGTTKRKGRNNALVAGAADPGSPWAIGGPEGGHRDIHPKLGTVEEFRALVERARTYRMEIALDIAFQCSPDHPWVTEHPQWFVHRPDGTIQYAENPPKKYEDIYPLNFETEDWEALWAELKAVFEYWIEQGVKIFRVDNPHTKSFPFWEWLIAEIRAGDPEVIFLAEAFTRPKRMYRLAKAGFTHSYTYFTWRNSPAELREYLTELTEGEAREFFRPNFWPNTPDILHEDLQSGLTSVFKARFALAATLSSNYGIYGPAFECVEYRPREEGSEEYLDSEKYQIRDWTKKQPCPLEGFITRINTIRRENPALQETNNIRFHTVDNDKLLCFSKRSGDNTILVCVNMDYENVQAGWIEFSPAAVGYRQHPPFVVRDLLTDVSYTWREYWNFIRLDPAVSPVHIFVLELS